MKARLTFLSIFCALTGACHGLNNGNIAPENPTTLRVDNQGFSDMDIFALRGGQRVRLGMVVGHQNSVFKVPSVLIAGLTPMRFIADPIGSTRASVSEEITVAPGDSVVLTIPPL